MGSKTKPQMDDLVRSIGELAKAGNELAHQAEQQYAPEVEEVLRTQCRDPHRIERLLDGILDFCFNPAMLRLYKKLCRYYFTINPDATVSYVNAYRNMWDEGGGSLEGDKQSGGSEGTALLAGIREQVNNQDLNSIEFEGIRDEEGRNGFLPSANGLRAFLRESGYLK